MRNEMAIGAAFNIILRRVYEVQHPEKAVLHNFKLEVEKDHLEAADIALVDTAVDTQIANRRQKAIAQGNRVFANRLDAVASQTRDTGQRVNAFVQRVQTVGNKVTTEGNKVTAVVNRIHTTGTELETAGTQLTTFGQALQVEGTTMDEHGTLLGQHEGNHLTTAGSAIEQAGIILEGH
jgi:hypothetical protein